MKNVASEMKFHIQEHMLYCIAQTEAHATALVKETIQKMVRLCSRTIEDHRD